VQEHTYRKEREGQVDTNHNTKNQAQAAATVAGLSAGILSHPSTSTALFQAH